MRPAVLAVFPSFTERFEGHVDCMYLDVKGLVTTGRGNLIDPTPAALVLPWLRSDGSPASRAEIASEWVRIKGDTALAQEGWRAADRIALLRLTTDAINALTLAKLHANDAILSARFAGWEDLPAAAQLAVHSMAWACGPAFRFPRFEAALAARDWGTYVINADGSKTPLTGCMFECHLDETGNPGLRARNIAQVDLFVAAINHADTIPGWPVSPDDVITEPELPLSPAAAGVLALQGVVDATGGDDP